MGNNSNFAIEKIRRKFFLATRCHWIAIERFLWKRRWTKAMATYVACQIGKTTQNKNNSPIANQPHRANNKYFIFSAPFFFTLCYKTDSHSIKIQLNNSCRIANPPRQCSRRSKRASHRSVLRCEMSPKWHMCARAFWHLLWTQHSNVQNKWTEKNRNADVKVENFIRIPTQLVGIENASESYLLFSFHFHR